MSAAPAQSPRAVRLAARLAATAAHLSGVVLPPSGEWLRRAREAAMGRLRAQGLPEKRDEYWRYTDPARLISLTPQPAEVLANSDESPEFGAINRLRLVFVDGVFDAAQSDALGGEGIEITRLAEAGAKDLHWAQELYGRLGAPGRITRVRNIEEWKSA